MNTTAKIRWVCAECGNRDQGMCESKSLKFHPVEFGPRKTVFGQGESASRAYFVRSGLVRTFETLADGHYQGLRLVRSGGYLGLDALGKQQYPSSAETVSAAVLCPVRLEELDSAIKSDHDLCKTLNSQLIEELRDLRGRLHEVSLRRVKNKVAAFLVCQADPAGNLPSHLYQRDVADFLGIAPETVCRVLTSFKKSGWVSLDAHRLHVGDVGALRQVAESAEG